MSIDFSTHALADEGFWDHREFCSEFMNSSFKYDVSKCEIVSASWQCNSIKIFVSVFNLPRSYCYAFNLKKAIVQILDPLNTTAGGDSTTIDYHSRILPIIVKAMQECMSTFFSGWSVVFSKWHCVISDGYTPAVKSRSVFHMLRCMRSWNGTECVHHLHENNILQFQKKMVFDTLHMKPNDAKPPQAILEIL